MSITDFWRSRPIDTHLFIRAKMEAKQDEIEQNWDYTRHSMWASIKPHIEKDIRPHQLIKLKRDGALGELSPYELQELKKWNEQMDKEMIHG